MTVTWSPDEARIRLCAWLVHRARGTGFDGVRAALDRLTAIQLDPLEPLGSNADLVALARVDDLAKGDVYRALLPGHAFEHFAKERCLLPARAFGWYRARAVETPWWRSSERMRKIPATLLDEIEAEIRERGPVRAGELTDRGAVVPLDWNGWKGTSKAASLALEVLWTQCRVVVCRRDGNRKWYDVPERALPAASAVESGDFAEWAFGERLRAAGLLSPNTGPQWSMLSTERKRLTGSAVARGEAVEVRITGSTRTWLASPAFVEAAPASGDDRMRILGPLDPLLWDRALVAAAFGFTYVWEVYKPAPTRRWGWYVVPLLHRDRLVGRLEGRARDGRLELTRVWRESPDFDERAFGEAVARHAAALGVAAPEAT